VYLVGAVKKDQAVASDVYLAHQFVLSCVDAQFAIIVEWIEDDSILL